MFGKSAVESSETADLEQQIRPKLQRVIAFINGKGGQGKTSITANLSGLLANAAEASESQRRVLAIDMDPQGNLALDLGYRDSPENDKGLSILQAVNSGSPLRIMRDVRPWLDVVPGGKELNGLPASVFSAAIQGRDKHAKARLSFATAVAQIADSYDWILMDCPPQEAVIQDLLLVAARAAVIPVSFDAASRDGMNGVAERFAHALELNDDLELLGAVMFNFNYTAGRKKASGEAPEVGQRKKMRQLLQEDLVRAGTEAPVFQTVIRTLATVAESCRDRGQLVHEIETATDGPKWWEVRSGKATGRPVPTTQAATLAQEYEDLAAEVITRFNEVTA